MDIVRNVGVREHVDDGAKANDAEAKASQAQLLRSSLPNILLKDFDNALHASENANSTNMAKHQSPENASQSSLKRQQPVKMNSEPNYDNDDDEVCAVSGRLEIRVVQQTHDHHRATKDATPSDAVDGSADKESAPGNINSVSDGPPKAVANKMNDDADLGPTDEALKSLKKYLVVTANESRAHHLRQPASADCLNDSENNCTNARQNGKTVDCGTVIGEHESSTNVENAAESTFVPAATALAKLSNDDVDSNVNANAICNANDSISINNDNKEMAVVSYSLYLNQSQLEQKDLSAINNASAANSALKALSTQSDGSASSNPPSNQINKRDTNSSSKIPIFSPSLRSTKCASWAGTDYPITAADLTNLTPGDLK